MKMHSYSHRGAAATIPGEDCLHLNLWTPEVNGYHKRPVMVYMHGGGFSSGSGHDLLSYDGESLAKNMSALLTRACWTSSLCWRGFAKTLQHLGATQVA
jgi:carboxylesterase type B